MDITLPWKIEDFCPCESGKPLRDCCLGPDGVPRIRIPSLIPPGPNTGYRNDRCYLNVTGNCSPSISKEHYISRSILEELGPLTFYGFPWDTLGNQITYGITNAPTGVMQAALEGEWHVLAMQCQVERLDGGDWIASEFKFSPIPSKPDFPFERVKGD
jgi:hypothetical protein